MGKFTMTHEIECDVDTFWKVFFDKEFNNALFVKTLGFPKFDVTEQRETDGQIVRKVSATPKMDVPGPVAKVLGNGFSYVEEGTFDKSGKLWKWKMIPGSMPDKIKTEGSIRVESAGPNKVRRVSEIFTEAKIFGIGGMLEGTAEKSLRQGYDESARFMNKWLKEHPAK